MQLKADKIRSRMFNLGITQVELAKRIGVSANTVNAVCRGCSCRDKTAAAIADALGVTLDSIIMKK